MASIVAPISAPRTAPNYQPGTGGRVAPIPATMSPSLRAQRQTQVPVARQGVSTVAPMAAAQDKYKETSNPFDAFLQGWTNAGAAREEEARKLAERDVQASALTDYPDLVQYVQNGSMDISDAIRIKESRDETMKQGQAQTARKTEIGNYLTELSGKDERYSKLAEQWAAGVLDEDGLSKAITDMDKTQPPTTDMQEYEYAVKDGYKGTFEEWKATKSAAGANAETFAMQPTYYEVPDPVTGEKTVQFGQLGNRGTFRPIALPDGAKPALPVQQLNTETGFVPVDKFGGRPEGAVETPINNQQAAYDTGVGKGQAEIDVAKPEKARKAQGALNALERQVGLVAQDIDKAIAAADNNPLFTTGFLGDWTSAVAGTPAYDLKQTLLTIQANIGFDRLQEMRNNSPTGGALGAISDKETALLQAVNGALAQGQSKDQFKANLERVKALQAEVLAERKQAFSTDFGDGPQPESSLPTPQTEEDYNALPSGTVYIDPDDGKQYRKP